MYLCVFPRRSFVNNDLHIVRNLIKRIFLVHSFLKECFAQSSMVTIWGYVQLIFKLTSTDVSCVKQRSNTDLKNEWTAKESTKSAQALGRVSTLAHSFLWAFDGLSFGKSLHKRLISSSHGRQMQKMFHFFLSSSYFRLCYA